MNGHLKRARKHESFIEISHVLYCNARDKKAIKCNEEFEILVLAN